MLVTTIHDSQNIILVGSPLIACDLAFDCGDEGLVFISFWGGFIGLEQFVKEPVINDTEVTASMLNFFGNS